MIPALVCRRLQYPDLTMAKATVRQLGAGKSAEPESALSLAVSRRV